MEYYYREEYENAFTEALKFNFPQLYLDPLMRAVSLAKMKRAAEAREAVDQLLKLEPHFATRGRWLIGRYVKVDELIDRVIRGLQEAGLKDID